MKMSALSIKITIPVVIISALAIGLTAFLNLGKFERTLTELENSRTQFVVNDIHANLDTGLALGLPLGGLANAQEVIAFEARKDPTILSITIYDDKGNVVFHTGQPLGSVTVPTNWKHLSGNKVAADWQVASQQETVVGTTLASVIGAPVGGLALRYSRREHNAVVDTVAHSLMLAAIFGIAGTALAASVGIHFLVARSNAKLQRIAEMLTNTAAPASDKSASDEAAMLAGVLSASRNALQDLTTSHAAILQKGSR